VVNDSLVLIDYANRLRRGGQVSTAFEAIHQAGVRRFRPIILTTMTTFGGLAPMIFETSRQARFLIPMALSLGYGIVFATSITLVLVPCLYMMLDDAEKLWARISAIMSPGRELEELALCECCGQQGLLKECLRQIDSGQLLCPGCYGELVFTQENILG